MILFRQLEEMKSTARQLAESYGILLGRFEQLRDWDDPMTPEWFARDKHGDALCLFWIDNKDGKPERVWSDNRAVYKTVVRGGNHWVIKLWLP